MKRNITILLVEDDPKWRKYYKKLLNDSGFSVETAESAREAYEKFLEEDPDFIITGVFMPDEDPSINIKWLLKKIKDENTGASVILLTSLDWLRNDFAYEADGFVLKRKGEEKTLIKMIQELSDKKHIS